LTKTDDHVDPPEILRNPQIRTETRWATIRAPVKNACWIVLRRFKDELSEPFYVLAAHLIICLLAVVVFDISSKALAFDGIGDRHLLSGITVEEWFFYLEVLSVTLILCVGIVRCVIRMWKDDH